MYWLVVLALSNICMAQYEPGKFPCLQVFYVFVLCYNSFKLTPTSSGSEGIEHFMFKRYEIPNKIWKGMDGDFVERQSSEAKVVPNWLDLF